MKKPLLSSAALAARLLPDGVKRLIYRFPPLARFIRRSLNRSAPQGMVEVKVAGGDLAGYTLRLDMQVDKDYWLGTYEMELQSAVRKFIPPGSVSYDVGANIGYISLLLAKAAGASGRVYAFEPLPSNIHQLRRNLALNALEDRITVVERAVIDSTAPVRFLVHASGGMGKAAGSAGREDPVQSAITVSGISLDEFAYHQNNPIPQAVKMDIEGGEVLALPGMRRLLAEARPLMLMELHSAQACRTAWETLSAAGYQICWMRRGYPPVCSAESLGKKAYIVGIHGNQ